MSRMRRRRLLLGLGAALVVLVVALSLLLHGRGPALTVEVDQPAQAPATEFHGTHLVARRAGERVWSLTADHLAQQGDQVSIEGIKDGTLYRDDKPHAGLSAPKALWNRTSGDVDFSGGVVLTYASGVKVTTERLIWHPEHGRIEAPEQVKLVQGDLTIVADEMRADTDTQLVRFSGNVHIEREDGLLLATRELVYHLDTKRADLRDALRGELPL